MRRALQGAGQLGDLGLEVLALWRASRRSVPDRCRERRVEPRDERVGRTDQHECADGAPVDRVGEQGRSTRPPVAAMPKSAACRALSETAANSTTPEVADPEGAADATGQGEVGR